MGFHHSSGNNSEATFLHLEYFFNPGFSEIPIIRVLVDPLCRDDTGQMSCDPRKNHLINRFPALQN